MAPSDSFSSRVAQAFNLGVLVVLLAPQSSIAACPSQGDIDVRQIAATSTSISYDSGDRSKTITTFGTLQNKSALCVQELVLEVKYFDAKGEQVDVTTQPLNIEIAPGLETAFRVRDDADKDRDAYATSTIRVISVLPLFSRARESGWSWVDFISTWTPLLVLVFVWWLIMRRFMGKNSPQRQSLDLVRQQQLSLERIAAAIEKRAET